MIKIIFQNIFYLKKYENKYFKKKLILILTYQNNIKILKNFKFKKKSTFLKPGADRKNKHSTCL
jgi:hypothetical protein